MIILAVDLGTNSGWALFVDGEWKASGAWDLSRKVLESPAMRPLRLQSLIRAAIGQHKPDIVAYEVVKQRPKSVAAGHTYGELRGALMMACESEGTPFTGIHVGGWKKHLTGKGNAGKTAIVQAVAGMGITVQSEDEADAIGIGKYAAEVGV